MAVAALVAVASLGIDGGDQPIRRHLGHDAKGSVVASFGVLASHHGQQLGCLGDGTVEGAALEGVQGPQGVDHQGVD